MKKLYSFLILSLLSSPFFGQNQWQEHLSHDRIAYQHHGHYLVNDEVVLLMGNLRPPMNTLETITGKSKKSQEIISQYFTFQTKTTRTGIDSKEILLVQPFDYDISGFGAHSIYERDNVFLNRNIQGDEYEYEYDSDYLFIHDAYMSGGPLDNKECIANNYERVFLNSDDQILSKIDIEGTFRYHEGLDGLPYQIHNGVFSSISAPIITNFEIGTYSDILNNPYENQLIEMEDNLMKRYSYDDFSLVRTDMLDGTPVAIQFIEGGFYYMTIANDRYYIHKYSDDSESSLLHYILAMDEEISNFDIKNFEVVGNDIYFFGLMKIYLNPSFDYVLKRTIDEDFTPQRKDLSLDEGVAFLETLNEYEHRIEYELTISNLGADSVFHYTLYTPQLFAEGPKSRIKIDVDEPIGPGETRVLSGEFILYSWPINSIGFSIAGVDFGLDSDYSNNYISVDIDVSTKDFIKNQFVIAPNPTSNYFSIEGDVSEIQSINLINSIGQEVKKYSDKYSALSVVDLPPGNYWLQINTKSGIELHPLIKQ